jgi:hypothetical protein
MKILGLKTSACGLLVLVLASVTAVAQNKETNFESLKLGLTRGSVISMLGAPNSETDSTTFYIKYERLTWIGAGNRQFIASFIQDRLWRWKSCSASVTNC